MLLPTHKAFPLADEQVHLQSLLEPESILSWLVLIYDMFVNPLWCFVNMVVGIQVSHFAWIGMIWKAGQRWKDWARYQVLRDYARNWVLLARCQGGPFISCNDPKYHVFVQAEAMERLRLLRGRLGNRPTQRRTRIPSKERLEA